MRSGIPVTTVARTLFDLSEFASLKRLESAWEEADRLNLLQLAAIEQVCERGYGRRALKPIRRLLTEARAPQITRSPLEDVFAAFCHEHHLPMPSFNTTGSARYLLRPILRRPSLDLRAGLGRGEASCTFWAETLRRQQRRLHPKS